MNEELQAAIADMIIKVADSVDSAAGFLSAEIPGYIQELMLWYSVKSVISFFAGFLILVVTILVTKKLSGKKFDKNGVPKMSLTHEPNYYKTEHEIAGHVPAILLTLIPIGYGLGLMSNLNWLKIWIAPKVWLIEYAASITR